MFLSKVVGESNVHVAWDHPFHLVDRKNLLDLDEAEVSQTYRQMGFVDMDASTLIWNSVLIP